MGSDSLGVLIGALNMLHAGSAIKPVALALVFGFAFLPQPDGRFPLNDVRWSIFFEVFANLMHALLLRRLPSEWLCVLVGSCALIVAYPGTLNLGQGDYFWFGFPRVLMSYSLGIIIWRWNGEAGRVPAWLGYAGLPAMVLVAWRCPEWASLPMALICCPLILLAGLSGNPSAGAFLGKLSFLLYAVHWPIQCALIRLGYGWEMALTVSLAGGVLVTVAYEYQARLLPVNEARR